MKTIGAALTENKGIGPGFDAMRVILALGVIGQHCFPVVSGDPRFPAHGPWWALCYAIVPMFFALSGFLVTGSAMRLGLGPFALSRALRIVPALFVDTAVSILVLGLAFTTLSPIAFLTHPLTLTYWLNCAGEIHYLLPGVFTNNPGAIVNASLWTIPGELCCYISMAALIISGQVKSWKGPLAGIAIIFAVDFAFHLFGDRLHFPMEKQLAGLSGKLIAVFLLGSIFYSQRDRIPLSPILATLSAAYMVFWGFAGSRESTDNVAFIAGASLALTYLVIWLGMQRIALPWPFRTGDYSYGMYLYGFPIQQAVVHLTGTRSPLVVVLLAIVPIMGMAALSWHFVEKPTLLLRKRLTGLFVKSVPRQ